MFRIFLIDINDSPWMWENETPFLTSTKSINKLFSRKKKDIFSLLTYFIVAVCASSWFLKNKFSRLSNPNRYYFLNSFYFFSPNICCWWKIRKCVVCRVAVDRFVCLVFESITWRRCIENDAIDQVANSTSHSFDPRWSKRTFSNKKNVDRIKKKKRNKNSQHFFNFIPNFIKRHQQVVQ